MANHNSRRDVLKGGAIGLTVMLAGSVSADEESSPNGTIQFDDQRSLGESVTISTVRTEAAGTLFVVTERFDVLAAADLPANTTRESPSISLAEPLSVTGQLHAILFDRSGHLVAGDTATISVGDDGSTMTVRDQVSTGESIEIDHLSTDVDASLFVFDATGQVIGGSGVRFVAGTELDSLTVPLEESLEGSQSVRVTLYESNGGPIARADPFVRVADAGPATLLVDDQRSDGSSIDVSYTWTSVDSSLFVFDESGDVIGGSGVTFDAGDEIRNLTVGLDEPLESSQELTVTLYESNGGPIVTQTVSVDVSDGPVASLTVEDQTSDGTSIDVASLRTDVDSSLFVFDEAGDVVGGSGVTFDAGDEVSSLTVALEEPLQSSQRIEVRLYESNGGPIARDTAYVTVN